MLLRSAALLLLPFTTITATEFETAAHEIVRAGAFLNGLHLCPATSGNFSRRIDESLVAITVSGKHKGELTTDDVLIVNLQGKPVDTAKRPSAETLLHTMLYAFSPDIGAVLHTHPLNAITLTRALQPAKTFVTEGYEIHKIFAGFTTHDSRLEIPIFENNQDIAAMAVEVLAYLKEHPNICGFLIRGHGLYAWGCTMQEAKVRTEAFEHLFETELKLMALQQGNR